MHNFVGKWRIVKMETWTQDFVDLEEPGYFEFSEDGLGAFVIGSIKGALDVQVSEKDSLLEYSWLGGSQGHTLSGRGNFLFALPDEGEGTFFIHTGGQSKASIRRQK